MTENEFHVWLEGYHERQDFERDIMRRIMWSSLVDGKVKRNEKPENLWPLHSDKNKIKALVDKFDKEEYLIKKAQIERLCKRKQNT